MPTMIRTMKMVVYWVLPIVLWSFCAMGAGGQTKLIGTVTDPYGGEASFQVVQDDSGFKYVVVRVRDRGSDNQVRLSTASWKRFNDSYHSAMRIWGTLAPGESRLITKLTDDAGTSALSLYVARQSTGPVGASTGPTIQVETSGGAGYLVTYGRSEDELDRVIKRISDELGIR